MTQAVNALNTSQVNHILKKGLDCHGFTKALGMINQWHVDAVRLDVTFT